MPDQESDLKTAIDFVSGRLDAAAIASGAPLSRDELFLLKNLPRQHYVHGWADAQNPTVTPSDASFERLCAIAKQARAQDEVNPDLMRNWHFALAVATLQKHPMSWLLNWSGFQIKKPWWDRLLLWLTALMFVACIISIVVYAEGKPHFTGWLGSSGIAFFYVALVMAFSIGARNLERWELRQLVENNRG